LIGTGGQSSSTAILVTGPAHASSFALNPNVLYLQATPMTEPLLLGLLTLGVALLIASSLALASEALAKEANELAPPGWQAPEPRHRPRAYPARSAMPAGDP
jgi:hypothetical protein